MARFKEIIVALAVLLAAWSAFAMPVGMDPTQASIFGIVTLSLWATGLVPGYVASAFFFTALLLGGLNTPDVVFSGFTSTAMWLIVAGFVIGAAITTSGLGTRTGTLAQRHLSSSLDPSRNCAAPLNTYRVAKENRHGITTRPGVAR